MPEQGVFQAKASICQRCGADDVDKKRHVDVVLNEDCTKRMNVRRHQNVITVREGLNLDTKIVIYRSIDVKLLH